MAVAIRAVSTQAGFTNATTVTGNKPTGTASGDLLVAIVWSGAAGNAAAQSVAMTGWAPKGVSQSYNSGDNYTTGVYVFMLDAGASEPSTYTASTTGSGGASADHEIMIFAVTGAAPVASQPDVAIATTDHVAQGGTSGAAQITNWASVTTVTPSLILAIAGMWDGVGTVTTVTGTPTLTRRTTYNNASGYLFVADGIQSSAGATGARTVTPNGNNASSTSRWASLLLPIAQAASGNTGAATGTGAAAGFSGSQGAASGVGAANGLSGARGAATGVGAAAGRSGARGAATGVGAATGRSGAKGTASGVGTATGIAQNGSQGVATGVGAAQGLAGSIGVASGNGAGTAIAYSADNVGQGIATGLGTAQGLSGAIGAATGAGAAQGLAGSQGVATGTGAATGAPADGSTAQGIATGTGAAAGFSGSSGAAAGTGTATGRTGSRGQATGAGSAQGYSVDLTPATTIVDGESASYEMHERERATKSRQGRVRRTIERAFERVMEERPELVREIETTRDMPTLARDMALLANLALDAIPDDELDVTMEAPFLDVQAMLLQEQQQRILEMQRQIRASNEQAALLLLLAM